MKRTTSKLTIFAAVSAMALGGVGAAQAKNGADDPAGHQRHGKGADDAQPHFRNGADDPAGDQRRGRGRDDVKPHARHGADDAKGHRRHGRGRDDGPNHR
jgi:hypothetical protein